MDLYDMARQFPGMSVTIKLEDLLRREIYTTIPTEDSGDDKKRISSVFKRRMKK